MHRQQNLFQSQSNEMMMKILITQKWK